MTSYVTQFPDLAIYSKQVMNNALWNMTSFHKQVHSLQSDGWGRGRVASSLQLSD